MVLAHDLQGYLKTKDIQIPENITFDTMFVSSKTLEGLKTSGFVRPSPIQLHGIPIGKCGFDLLLEAKSGTGKTVVFTVLALEHLDLAKGLQTVVLAPTREIAAQICDVFRQIGCKYDGLRVEVVMGGLPINEDIDKFKENNVHVVVGSPGRLKHLINDSHIDVSAVRLIVFDEADKLMEKSYLADIKKIYLALPKDKQVIMSSATFPEACKESINEFVHNVHHICPNSDCVLLGVVQKVTYVKPSTNTVIQTTKRFKELLKILTTKQFKQCLIFCNYRARVREVYKMLIREKWPAEQLYGAQDQMDRLDALKTLQDYKCRILISTDLAARGIDASNVDLVINFEPPIDWQTYLHRIGRAGRFGSYGMAITILSEGVELKNFMNLLDTANLAANIVSPLWTETESTNGDKVINKLSANQEHLHLNGSNDHCAELWKIICDTEVTPDEGVIEDFHELLNSFESTPGNTNGIKSFSDLLESFQINDLPDYIDGTEYKCMKLSNLTNQSFIGVTKKVKDTVLKMSNSPDKLSSNFNGSMETNDSLDQLSSNINRKQEKRNDSTNKFTSNVNGRKENKYSPNKLSSNINRSMEKCSDKIKIDVNKSTVSSDKLSSNFTASEEKNNDSIDKLSNNSTKSTEKLNAKNDQSEFINTEDNISKGNYKPTCNSSFPHQNINSKLKEKSFTKTKSARRSPRETSCSSSDEDIDIKNENRNKNTHSKIKNTHINKPTTSNSYPHYPKQATTSKTHRKGHATKSNRSINSFNEWYKELKIRAKQIELAVYIDELSKL